MQEEKKGYPIRRQGKRGTTQNKKPGTRTIISKGKQTGIPELQLAIRLNGNHTVNFEIDTGAGDNFLDSRAWMCLGQPMLTKSNRKFESASLHSLPILGALKLDVQVTQKGTGHF